MEVKAHSNCPLGITAKWPWDNEDKPVKAWDKTCQYVCPHYGGVNDGIVICNAEKITIKIK
jgi:hypothetical protein